MNSKYQKISSKILIGFSLLVLMCVVAPSISSAQSLTGDNPPGMGDPFGFDGDPNGSAFGGGGEGGGFGYNPDDAPGGGNGDPLITGQGSDQYSTPDDAPAYRGYCVDMPTAPFKDLPEVLKYITCLLNRSLVPLIFAIALITFLWGVVKFIQASSSSEKEEGRQFMLWGVIALAVMISVWGLVKILGGSFGVETVVPQLPVNPPK
ncbi:MAG: hypothetical protein KBC17_02490 [Candidatus Pacebacteria bacterium]|nr:hypothetical protein [Candidatus Paceibacterota bacterium]